MILVLDQTAKPKGCKVGTIRPKTPPTQTHPISLSLSLPHSHKNDDVCLMDDFRGLIRYKESKKKDVKEREENHHTDELELAQVQTM